MNCRSCGGECVSILNLGHQPLANALLASPHQVYGTYPLELMLCTSCHLGQLRDFAPADLFSEYNFYSAVSTPGIDRARDLVKRICAEGIPGMVVEIGSNDGYLLQFYRTLGAYVLGVDPARGPANAAALRGIPTVQAYFGRDLAAALPKADVIHANNVLAHAPDLNDFVAGLAILLKLDGECYIEVPYLFHLLEGCEFDTVYHEHCYYFSLRALDTLFRRHNMFIDKVEHLSAQGGSVRLRVRNYTCSLQVGKDERLRVDGLQARVAEIASSLRASLLLLREQGKRVWGFGAAAKATVTMNYCGLDSTLIEAVADDTPAKQGLYIPGTGVQVKSSADWLAAAPDYTCIFTWNHAQFVANKYAQTYKGTLFTPYILPAMMEPVR